MMDFENEIPVKLSELLKLLEDVDDWQLDQVNNDNGETNCDPAVLSPIATAGVNGVALSTQNHVKTRLRPKRIRKVGSVPYSTDLQRRRRTELLSLRAEAQELECRLTKFQQRNTRGTRPLTSQKEQGKWRSVVIVAREGREQAEITNRELKDILSSRLRLFASIGQLLKSCDVLKGIDLLSQNSRESLSQPATANSVLATISDSLDQMLVQADSVFPALDNYLTVALQTHQKRHEVCGTLGDTCVETISVTPMPCTISKSGTILWQQLVSRKDAEPDKLYRFIRASHDTALEMSFTLLLNDETSKLLCVDAVSAYRKYEQENRFVLVGKTTWKPRSGGLEFETFHWTVIEPPPKHSLKLQSCVVQSCNRLQVKRWESTSASARRMLLTSIGSRLRSFMKLVQKGLLRSATAHPE